MTALSNITNWLLAQCSRLCPDGAGQANISKETDTAVMLLETVETNERLTLATLIDQDWVWVDECGVLHFSVHVLFLECIASYFALYHVGYLSLTHKRMGLIQSLSYRLIYRILSTHSTVGFF